MSPEIECAEQRKWDIVQPKISSAGSPSLCDNALWLLTGNIAFAICQYAIVIVLARLGDAAMVGQYALAVAATAPIVLLANCALRTVQAAESRYAFRFGDYLAFRLLALGIASLLIVAVVLLSDRSMSWVMLAIGASKVFESLGDLVHGTMQKCERMDLIGWSQLIKGIGSLAAVVAILWTSHDLVTACWGFALVFAAVFLLFDVPQGAALANPADLPVGHLWLQPLWDWRRLRNLASLTLPMGFTVMTGALIVNIPRYFLSYYHGEGVLGIYAALAWLVLAGNMFASALAHAALPRWSQYYASVDAAKFRELLWSLMIGGVFAGTVAVLLGSLFAQPTLEFLYGPEYAEHAPAFRVLILSMAFSLELCFLDHALYAAQWFRVQVPLNLLAMVMISVSCWMVTPHWGLLGVAWTVCAVTAMQMLIRFLIVSRILRELSRLACRLAQSSESTASFSA